MSRTYIAVDFGGGSGRVIAGSLSGGTLTLTEVHRFANRQVRLGSHLYWDFLMLFDEMMTGLHKAAKRYDDIYSIAIDTWGVDFGLIDRNGNLLGNPVCYRDEATMPMLDLFFTSEDREKHYHEAGLQPMTINSLFRLLAMREEHDPKLEVAEHLLFMPDLFSYYLTGVPNNEYTIASTSELLLARERKWNRELIRRLGLPEKIFCPIVMPGETRGTLTAEVARRLHLSTDVKVVAVGSHDTASAVHAIKGDYGTDGTAFLSSGTWSLLGVEIDEPITVAEAEAAGFSNEGGTNGKIHFLQNITGLWILQQLVAGWEAKGMTRSYPELVAMAEASDCDTIIDVDDDLFQRPGDMEEAIETYCKNHGLKAPDGQGDTVRCVLLSLADRYRRGIEGLNRLLPSPVKRLHIIGGGSRNQLLNQLTARSTGLEVSAGPAEATAIGNILMQAQASGELADTATITEIIES